MARVRAGSPTAVQMSGETSVRTRATHYSRDTVVVCPATFHPIPSKMRSSEACRRCSHTWTPKLFTSCSPSVTSKVTWQTCCVTFGKGICCNLTNQLAVELLSHAFLIVLRRFTMLCSADQDRHITIQRHKDYHQSFCNLYFVIWIKSHLK